MRGGRSAHARRLLRELRHPHPAAQHGPQRPCARLRGREGPYGVGVGIVVGLGVWVAAMGSAHHAVGEVDDSRGPNHATVEVPYWSEIHMNETSVSVPLGVSRYTTVIGLDWSMSEYGSVLDTMAGAVRSEPSDDQLPALPCQAAATSTLLCRTAPTRAGEHPATELLWET